MTVKVLQVLGRSAGGIARHVADITAALAEHDGLAIDIAGPPGLPVEMPVPVMPVVIPSGPLRGHRAAVRTLRGIAMQGGYQLVHAHGLRAGIDAALAVRGSEVTVIVTVHNLVHPDVAGVARALLYRRSESLVVRLADKVLAVSRDIADHLAASVPDAAAVKIEVLHLGVEGIPPPTRSAREIHDELGLTLEQRVVVTASRLSAQKALDVMLAAVARVDCHLVILGEGPLESELRDLAIELGIAERVHFSGFRHDVADVIAAADVFCLSSVWEGVPLAALEATQIGVPVVATDVGGTGELIRDRISGRLVPPRDPEALAAALTEVLSDPDLRASYVAAARKTLDDEFDRSKMLERLATLYLGAAS